MPELALRPSLGHEKPLSPVERGALVVRAALTILLFYLTAILFMAGLSVIAFLLLLVAIGAARFGLATFVTRILQVPVRLLGIFGRRLWLVSHPSYGIVLQPHEAPALFALAAELAERSGLAAPESILIEMHVNAWVHLRGYRRGRGRTRLGIGFDLLAGLNVSEVEAVLAHELTHARLIQRGFSRWLKKGLTRLIHVTNDLAACAASYRQLNARSDLADTSARVFDALTRRAVRLVATYSRQDEFAADGGAAALCGAAAIRSALTRLAELNEVVGGLAWGERLARMQPGETFTPWLVGELTAARPRAEALHHAADPYSTHPALHDRLAALPPDTTIPDDARPGVALFADPDRIAERLVAEIQRLVAIQEEKDTRRLARETKNWCRREATNWMAVLGGFGLLTGLIFTMIAVYQDFPTDSTIMAAWTLVAGMLILANARYRDRRSLPIPVFGTLVNPRPSGETQEQLRAAEASIVQELRAAAAGERSRRRRVSMLVHKSYAALSAREYLRAHVAARLALELDRWSVEAGLAYAIAAGGLGNAQQMWARLRLIKRKVGFKTTMTKWGAAWALSMVEDWNCEGLLEQLRERRPDVATFTALLALAQLHRQKLQSAIRNAESALILDRTNKSMVLTLVHALLLAGRVKDAAARLEPLAEHARADGPTAFTMLRLRSMQRDTAGALEWAEVVRGLDTDGSHIMALGHVFMMSRLPDPASTYYAAAAAAGFVPEANIGLSILASARGDRAAARDHLLAGLKLEGARFTKNRGMGDVLHEILGRLNGLAERRHDCKSWIATLPAGKGPLAGHSLLVCAIDEAEGRGHLEIILAAMMGPEAISFLTAVRWRLAPKEQQPDRPVPPGVHSVVA